MFCFVKSTQILTSLFSTSFSLPALNPAGVGLHAGPTPGRAATGQNEKGETIPQPMPVVLLLPECGVLPAVGDGGQSGANPGKTDVRQYDLTPPVY